MQHKSRKGISIVIICCGVVTLLLKAQKIDPGKIRAVDIVFLIASLIFIFCGVISLRNSIKKEKAKQNAYE